MPDYAQLKVPDDEKLTDTDYNAEFANVYTGLNNVSTSQLVAKAVSIAKLADAANPEIREAEHGFQGYVDFGWRFGSATTLSDCVLTAGVAFVVKTSSTPDTFPRIDRSAGSIAVPTLTANTTNYVFLKADNTLRVSTTATVLTDELLVITLVTNATTVTSNTFNAPTNPFAGLIGSTVQHYIDGLELAFNSTTTVDLKPGAAELNGIISSTVTISLNITTAVWLNGASGANQNAYMYINNNGSNGITLAVSAQAPNLSDVNDNTAGRLRYRKYGSTYHRYVGFVRQGAAAVVVDFIEHGDPAPMNPFYRWRDGTVQGRQVLTAGASISFTDVDCASAMPSTARNCIVVWDSNTVLGEFRIRENGGPTNRWEVDVTKLEANINMQFMIEVDAAQIFEYIKDAGAATLNLYIWGFWDRR